MTKERPIRSVAVVGGGIVGLSAASAFARTLPGTSVTLIETPRDPAALADLLPTSWPGMERFHRMLGIDELELVRGGIATHHLGTIFADWGASSECWIHAFGDYGKPAGAIPFDQIWRRARESGDALSYGRYSVGAALARAGKFVHPVSDSNSLGSRYQYGLRFDPDRYRDRLRLQADRSGVSFAQSDAVEIERSQERGIAALLLSNAERVEADLFVDCTGPKASLISAIEESFEDWSAWMPFDRLALVAEAHSGAPTTADRVRASDDGWCVEWPLQRRTLGAKLRIGGEGLALTRGRRLRPWVRNLLAIGESATALDPLHGMSLHAAHHAILLALELLPGRDFNPVETEEYNRRAEQLTRRMRDFIALHYLRSGRATGIWADLARASPPDSLARTLDQYEYRGRLPFHEDETITRDSWTASLIGLGVLPEHVDPQAGEVPLEQALRAMRQLAHEIEETVARVPDYAGYLASMIR